MYMFRYSINITDYTFVKFKNTICYMYDFSATKIFFENRHVSLEYHMIFPHDALP